MHQEDASWPASLGITTAESGVERAGEARIRLLNVARESLQGGVGMDLAALVTRTQALHDGAKQQCEAGNPHTTFTLLRAMAEHCAAMEYMIDKPVAAAALWDHDGHGVPVGRLLNHAKNSGRAERIGDLYDVLSKFAHPTALSYWTSWRVDDESERKVSWASFARFKTIGQELSAWGWLVELTELASSLIREYGDRGSPIEPEL